MGVNRVTLLNCTYEQIKYSVDECADSPHKQGSREWVGTKLQHQVYPLDVF